MQQVYLLTTSTEEFDFENFDALPVSEHLLKELSIQFATKFSASNGLIAELTVSAALEFLGDFYARYELSQPQRRVKQRWEQLLKGLDAKQTVKFVAVEVSQHRSRRTAKKIQQLY